MIQRMTGRMPYGSWTTKSSNGDARSGSRLMMHMVEGAKIETEIPMDRPTETVMGTEIETETGAGMTTGTGTAAAPMIGMVGIGTVTESGSGIAAAVAAATVETVIETVEAMAGIETEMTVGTEETDGRPEATETGEVMDLIVTTESADAATTRPDEVDS